ncbi:MAG: hypothetical protein NC412_01700 [Roseburia sp.]|nr:hypothetical protein [Roseburia sp.]MCM1277971.1 hypothetical protein [Robinsoniella sp.]
MRPKTKIVVLHMKELIYTGIFVLLGILFIILLILMFLPKNKETAKTQETASATYVPGVYTASLILNNHAVDIQVVVDENNINSIQLVNLDEAVTTMYPLIEPAFEEIIDQIYEGQSLENITYSDDNKYTSSILLEAIGDSLEKAAVKNAGVQTEP